MRRYRSSLKFLITHRWAGIAITLAICVLSVISIAMAGMELIPEMDQGQISVSVSMPNGSTMEDTAAIQDRIAGIVMDKVPETEQIYYSTGDSTSIMSSASGARASRFRLVDLDKRDRSAQEITKQLRRDLADIAGCEITVSASESMSMSTDSDISVELTGDDYDQLRRDGGRPRGEAPPSRTRSTSSPLPASRRRASRSRCAARTPRASV